MLRQRIINNHIRHISILCFFLLIVSCEKAEEETIYSFSGDYVALGDSITYGKGSINYKSWSDLIVEWMRIKNYDNYAVCGAFASSRFPNTSNTQFDLITQIENVNPNADLVTVMIGINDCLYNKRIGSIEDEILLSTDALDSANSFTQGLIYDLRELKSNAPEALVIMISPPGISYEVKTELSEYISAEKKIAEAFNIPFIDISDSGYSSTDSRLCHSDRIHPTDRGYQLIASYILPKLIFYIENR